MAVRQTRFGALSGRLETFRVEDRNPMPTSDYAEHGWAATAAWRRPITPSADLLLEAQRVASARPERVLAGRDPRQSQTVLQGALRVRF
jgi:hypothetical protein